MFSRAELEQIGSVCRAIGNEVSGEDGFVRIKDLLSRFQAEIHIRPLLVEGMIAQIGDGHESRWAVLADQDTYGVTLEDLDRESSQQPLPPRFRNTVAHELVHSLAFRPSEFGLRLKTLGHKDAQHSPELVAEIERETERLSPALLWAERALEDFVRRIPGTAPLAFFESERSRLGLSRPVFVQRLSLLCSDDPGGYLERLQDTCLGIAEWGKAGSASLRSWPLFANFSRGFLPSFLRDLRARDRLPASSITADVDFAMTGGDRSVTVIQAKAGTQRTPGYTDMRLELSVDVAARNVGGESLFLIRAH